MAVSIHPSVGVARLGNAKGDMFLLNPTKIGGLPYTYNDSLEHDAEATELKNPAGCIYRQGQVFKVFDEKGDELTLASPKVEKIEWTVHLANKKAAWYEFQELNGNLLYGEENSYKARNTPWRNHLVTNEADRQGLIIDLGPRSVSGRLQEVEVGIHNVPDGYKKSSFPDPEGGLKQGSTTFESLGTLRTDKQGRLIVLGGYGFAGGNTDLGGYGGGDEWYDDISDGSVTCVVTFKDASSTTTHAWVIVGSPDFAPEIVNISNLNDTFFDVGVRHFNLLPALHNGADFNKDYVANFDRDILPIIKRISDYQWVANVQSMSGFFSYHFNYSDNSESNKPNRMKYYDYFRQLDNKVVGDFDQPQQQLLHGSTWSKEKGYHLPPEGDILPMMPMNSGSNSVSSANGRDNTYETTGIKDETNVVEKFLALDATQMFLLQQWAQGKFTTGAADAYPVAPMDMAGIGNCVGLPMCPGIEVTWSLQNPTLYDAAYQIKHHQNEAYYAVHGLSPSRDECEGGGCEPGDLTKRMACPWQADFFNCTVQLVNFSEPKVNKAIQTQTQNQSVLQKTDYEWSELPTEVSVSPQVDVSLLKVNKVSEEKAPLPPAYYSYWWPPQSPWDVLTGELEVSGQLQSHLPAGQQINYARGINSYSQMVEHWSALAFIRNRNANNEGYPYFTESERNNELFEFREVGVGSISGNSDDNDTTLPVFFINGQRESLLKKGTVKGRLMADYFEERAFKPVRCANVLHRSGTRLRG